MLALLLHVETMGGFSVLLLSLVRERTLNKGRWRKDGKMDRWERGKEEGGKGEGRRERECVCREGETRTQVE